MHNYEDVENELNARIPSGQNEIRFLENNSSG